MGLHVLGLADCYYLFTVPLLWDTFGNMNTMLLVYFILTSFSVKVAFSWGGSIPSGYPHWDVIFVYCRCRHRFIYKGW